MKLAGILPFLERFRDRPDEPDSPWPDILRGGVVAAIFFIGFLGWAALAPLEAAIVGRGVVIVAGNRQAVQHRDGGIVRALLVKDGDHVEEGQVVLELVDTDLANQERALGGRLIELEAQKARLRAEAVGGAIVRPGRWSKLSPTDVQETERVLKRQTDELAARRSAREARIAVLKRQKQELEARLPGQEEERVSVESQVKLLNEELAGLNTLLQRGLTTVTRVKALERERVNLEGRAGRLVAEMAQTRESISQTEGQIASFAAEESAKLAEELRAVDTELADVAPKYDSISAQLLRTRLRAPATGEVVGLTTFTVGGVIQPGAHVMDIVPAGRRLRIETQVAPEDGDELRSGVQARVRFPGIRGRDVPILMGTVATVSADRIVDQQTGHSYFRLEVEVPTAELDKLSHTAANPLSEIRPGIPAEVVIPLRARTALQYLYEPLTNALWTSFRER